MPTRFLTAGLAACLLFASGCDGAPAAPNPERTGDAAPGPAAGERAPEAQGATEVPGAPQATHPDGTEDRKPTPPPLADTSGPHMFARVLDIVVTEDGLVRYERFADRELREALERVVTWYDRTPVPSDRNEKLAFLCNAYNANVLARASRESVKPGFESVAKVPGFFDSRPIRVGRESMTLNDLESRKIRPIGDARIHAALVCAAKSCPPLRSEPYLGANLDAQFDDQCKRWVNDPAKFRIVDGELGLSEILKWYGDDFRKPPYGNPTGFVLAYANPSGDVARFIANQNHPPTRWLTYDWALNQAK